MKKFNKVRRAQDGSISVVLLLVVILMMVVGASFSYDYARGLFVKERLSNATDAGALGGVRELVGVSGTTADVNRAEKLAREIAALNRADSMSVVDSDPATSVSVNVNPTASPVSVKVTATRLSNNMFASLIGWGKSDISSSSTASAFQGLTDVRENQLLPLAVSLDHAPTNGPQDGVALNSLVGPGMKNQKFTVVMNPQNSKNASWIVNWTGTANPRLVFGEDSLILNGVKATFIQDMEPGDTIYLPLIMGGPPFNQSRTIVGVVGMVITEIDYPLHISGRLKDPTILKGTPGVPVLEAIGQESSQFLEEHRPWTIKLTD